MRRFLFERYDNYDCVIAAYNAGHGAVDKWLKDPEFSRDGKTLYRVPYAETENTSCASTAPQHLFCPLSSAG